MAYVQVARSSFRRFATYRGATLAGVVTNTVFGFIRVYTLLAVYKHRTTVGAFSAADVVTYTFVTQGMAAAIGVFGYLELTERIPSGDVVTDLYRPLDFQGYWLATELGRASFQTIFRGVPPVLIGALFFHLLIPSSPGTIAGFCASFLLAVVIAFEFRFVVVLAGFWLMDARGIAQLASLVAGFFSGFIVPLAFFPGGLLRLAHMLPFASTVEYPLELFLGLHHGFGPTSVILAQQVLWAVVLWLAGDLVLRRAYRRVVVQGG